MSIPIISTAIAVAAGVSAYRTLSPIVSKRQSAEPWPVTKGVVLGVISFNAARRVVLSLGPGPFPSDRLPSAAIGLTEQATAANGTEYPALYDLRTFPPALR